MNVSVKVFAGVDEEWERTIDFVRQSYSGPLTYEFQTDPLKDRGFIIQGKPAAEVLRRWSEKL